MALFVWFQSPSGLSINTDIPIWGAFLVLIAAVGAFAALKMQMTAHEKSDDDRFTGVNDMLKEIRGDVKQLLGRHEET